MKNGKKYDVCFLSSGLAPPWEGIGILESRGFAFHLPGSGVKTGAESPGLPEFHALVMDLDGFADPSDLVAALAGIHEDRLPLLCIATRPSAAILEACPGAGVWSISDKESGPDVLAANLHMALAHSSRDSLGEQNRLFQSLLKVLPLGVFMVEAPSGRPLVANEAALELLGRGILPDASRENLATVYKAYVAGTDQPYPENEMPILRGMSGEFSHVDNLQVERPDGSRKLLEIFGTPVISEAGNIEASMVTFLDITDRKSSELALKASEARYSRVIDALNDGIWEWNVLTGNAYFSPSYYRILGYDDQEFPSDYARWKALVHPEDVERVESVLRECIGSDRGFSLDYRMKKKDGSWLWVCSRGKVAESDGEGHARLMSGNFSDISRRKEAEAETSLNLVRMQTLVEILQYRSSSVQDFLDYALEQILSLSGSLIGYIYHYDEDSQEFTLNTWSKEVMADCRVANPVTRYDLAKTGLWGEVVRQRKPIVLNDFKSPHPHKKGVPAGHVELHNFLSIPVFSNGEIVGVLGLGNKAGDYTDTDVIQATVLLEAVWKTTERMQAEQRVKELLAEKELILKEVHHRIRNNLTAISSLLEIQASEQADALATAALDGSAQRVRSMLHLYTRLYESQEFLEMGVPEFLPGLVQQIVANFPPVPGLKVLVDVDDFVLKVHKLQPIGILVNELITNCMKYAYKGRTGGELRVSLKRTDRVAVLRVADDGPGIPENPQPGSSGGFGMTLVALMAGQIGGTLEISHESGGGLSISFPLSPSALPS